MQNKIENNHRAGFVNILGKPNVGKSTLMNNLVKEHLSIVSHKAQTTRHRVMGIINEADFQIVYSDTPGIIKPNYQLQEAMMNYVDSALKDADVLLFVTEVLDKKVKSSDLINKLNKLSIPVFVLINKVDLASQDQVLDEIESYSRILPNASIMAISAKNKFNTDVLKDKIVSCLPKSPAFFPKDQLTDRPTRFFVSEIIRQKIFLYYNKEIPYSCEVRIESFKEDEKLVKIRAVIVVARESQKGILIGAKGAMLKKVGTQARKEIEEFLEKKVFLELFVKVDKDWRNKENKLKQYGY